MALAITTHTASTSLSLGTHAKDVLSTDADKNAKQTAEQKHEQDMQNVINQFPNVLANHVAQTTKTVQAQEDIDEIVALQKKIDSLTDELKSDKGQIRPCKNNQNLSNGLDKAQTKLNNKNLQMKTLVGKTNNDILKFGKIRLTANSTNAG